MALVTVKTLSRNRPSGRIGSLTRDFDDDEGDKADNRHDDHGHDFWRGPGERPAAKAGEQDKRAERGHQQHGAKIVDAVADLARMGLEGEPEAGESDDAERQVDVKDPVPAQIFDEPAAQKRAGDARQRKHASEDALDFAAILGLDNIADDRKGENEEAAAAKALDGARNDKKEHRLRQARQRRAGKEQDDCGDDDDAPAVEVAELAVDRRDNGRGQDIGGDHPAQVIDAAEIGDDGRQRGGNDGLVERGEQQQHRHRGDDDAYRIGHAMRFMTVFGQNVLRVRGRREERQEAAFIIVGNLHVKRT